MNVRHVPALLTYSPDKMRKVGLVVQVPNFIGEGEVIRVGNEEQAVAPGDLVCAPAGEEHGVRNPGPERLVLLVVMAPKP